MSNTRIGVVMDPIESISPAKDSTLAMLLEAQKRGHECICFGQDDLRLDNGEAWGTGQQMTVFDHASRWFERGKTADLRLSDLDAVLMRKDPPFDMEYIYTTYILERAELAGTLIVNKPSALRDMNEKAYTAWFPECCPEGIITRSMQQMREFLHQHEEIVVKPLDGMGGKSIFVIRIGDNNANVIFETLTNNETRFAIAQKYIPEITKGDNRIILIGGRPAEYALARVPPDGDNRGNLVMGAQAEVRKLTQRELDICSQVGPVLNEKGVMFAGLDIIGDYLTEINVTSPTGIRELAKLADLDLAKELFDEIDTALA
ncbi:MAG: glutathione synthase [Gammaproteobacteria bacterium]